ncbi:16240_t:CDS:2, partial [Gigaspora margarita]
MRGNDTNLDFGMREGIFDRRSEMSEGGLGVRGFSAPDLQYIALERSLEKTVQATMEKVVSDIKKSVQLTQSVDENKYWPKEKMNKPRDQFEDWEGVLKVREIVATRVFMLRDKLASARQLVKNKHPKVGCSMVSSRLE